MHFFPYVSVILATAALVTSEPSAQLFEPFDVAALDGNTFFTDTINDGNLAGLPSTPTGEGAPGAQIAPQQSPQRQQQQRPSPGISPYGQQEQQGPPPGVNPYGQQQQGIPSDGGPPPSPSGGQNSIPEEFTRPPPGYPGNQHCREYGGCPFECHTGCVCWEWCKNSKCNLAVYGEQALSPSQLSCDPSAGENFIGKVCRPYCANWCEDIKNQVVQSLPSDSQKRAFLQRPLECDKNAYLCPNDPNPNGLDCLNPPNPLDPGLGGQSGLPGGYGNPQQQRQQQDPNFGPPPGAYNNKELDKTNDAGLTEFSLDGSF